MCEGDSLVQSYLMMMMRWEGVIGGLRASFSFTTWIVMVQAKYLVSFTRISHSKIGV